MLKPGYLTVLWQGDIFNFRVRECPKNFALYRKAQYSATRSAHPGLQSARRRVPSTMLRTKGVILPLIRDLWLSYRQNARGRSARRSYISEFIFGCVTICIFTTHRGGFRLRDGRWDETKRSRCLFVTNDRIHSGACCGPGKARCRNVTFTTTCVGAPPLLYGPFPTRAQFPTIKL